MIIIINIYILVVLVFWRRISLIGIIDIFVIFSKRCILFLSVWIFLGLVFEIIEVIIIMSLIFINLEGCNVIELNWN